jgi:hypothetical protein
MMRGENVNKRIIGITLTTMGSPILPSDDASRAGGIVLGGRRQELQYAGRSICEFPSVRSGGDTRQRRECPTGAAGAGVPCDAASLRRRAAAAGGDELGRTQRGNNNAYCQDNEITWFDWLAVDADLRRFTKDLIAVHLGHPVFRGRRYLTGKAAVDLRWFTPAGTHTATTNPCADTSQRRSSLT